KIPSPDVRITVKPVAGDNTDAIQKAIDQVSKMKPVDGFRGTVLLMPGTYDCERTISLHSSGVVLRGSGSGKDGTVINMTGKPHTCISIRGNVVVKNAGNPVGFADTYVPSGTFSFRVTNTAGFREGDTIRITRPVTEAWIKFMGMHELVRDGKKQTWISGDITTERVIKSITGKRITVDIPLTDNFNAKYLDPPGVTVGRITSSGELSQIGIENFRIVSPGQSVTINEGHHQAFRMSGMADGWARNIEVINTVNSISVTGKRITVDNVSILHDQPTIGAAKPADLNGSGQQLLFNQCSIKGDNLFFFGTGAKVTGPVVLLNCVFEGNGWIQPHQRWATGLLVDGCRVPQGGIDFMNRGVMGSGHGWTIGWAVAWNCSAKSFLNQQPPGAANWVIGGQGEQQKRAIPFNTEPFLPEGIYDSYQVQVSPASLYLAQLFERLGSQALLNIGYSIKDIETMAYKHD
ncbi:MAG TPA: hypothetical protein VFX58_11770, partial [Chitinophagaceae bacterium]|nr:hypothetical protein [Chitinophagaceae bacterium]